MIHVRPGDPHVFVPAGDDLTNLNQAFPYAVTAEEWPSTLSPGHRPDGVVLVVESGPDAGLVVPLPRGTTTVGRGNCRIRLTDPSVRRHHAHLHVSPDGIRLEALGQVMVNGHHVTHRRVDEDCLIAMGNDRLRILARIPSPAPPPTPTPNSNEWDVVKVNTPPPPSPPFIAAVGAVAPLAVGGVLVAVTGNWLMLLFGCIGLLTGAMTVVDVLHRRRRQAREESRAALAAAALVSRRHPPPGSWVASFRNPRSRADTEAPPPVRLGECVKPRIRVLGAHDARPRRRVPVRQLPALCSPAAEQDVRLLGPPELVCAAVRALALAWLPAPGPRTGTGTAGTLRVAATESLPARILALPGVCRSPDTDAAVLTRTSAGGVTNRVLLGGQPADDDLVVRLGDGTLPAPSGNSVRFVPDRLSLTGALIAVSSLPPDEGPARVDLHQEPTAQPGDLIAVLGRATPDSAVGGDLTVSLVRDGPHALVAGTTGSGKSVLLSTWLSSLTEHTGPDRLRLVLLDFKGGATFGQWTGTPHAEAIVTDLDLESTARVVEGISAELHRRERLLQHAGAADVRDLPVDERPPRIVVAVDEFRILAEAVPGVLKDLMHCATVGRSLGLHLILATQRPQGVVSPEIRANVALTICLRLTSESEAVDLTGTPLPARFPTTEPGRALIRRGSARPEPFQVDTHIGRDADGARHDLLIGPTCADVTNLPVPASSARATQQPAPALPFIAPPLPQRPVRVAVPQAPNRHGDGQRSLVLGLKATPERVIPWTHTPATDGSLAVLAAPGSHRTEQVRSWLGALHHAGTADSCVVMDGDGLADNSALAHFPGLVLTPGQEQDVDEVLTALVQGRAPHPGIRPLLVLTAPSAWFGDGLQPAGVAREAAVMTLLANRICPVILVGGRDLSTSRLLGHAPWRVYQPWSMTPETTATWPRRHSCSNIPGRGVLLGPDTDPNGVVVQSTLAPDDRLRPKRSRHHSGAPGSTNGAWAPLPARLTSDAWRRRRPTTHTEPDPPFAVRAPDLRPVDWLPASNAAVVLGGPGSGRSTVVKELATRWPHACLLTRADLEELAGGRPPAPPPPERVDDDGRQLEAWWCVDDLDSLEPSALAVLSQRVRNGGRVLVAASSAASLSNQVPWWHHVDQAGGVLVLGPRGTEAATLGWRIPSDPTAPPGRAWFVPTGESSPVRVQVLQPTEMTGVRR